MKRKFTSRGRPIKSRTPLAIFKKASGLTSADIFEATGESISTLDKVSAGITSPMPLQMAEAISSRYGVSRSWLRREVKSAKALRIAEDAPWTHYDIPLGPALEFNPKDKITAYVDALDAVAKEIDYRLTPPPKEKGQSDEAYQQFIKTEKWKWNIAAAFDWYSFTGADQSPRATTPAMKEAVRHIATIEKRWNTAQQKFKESERETVEHFFSKARAQSLAKARMIASSPMLVQELESLLSDAGRHPQGPLITKAIVSSLHQIRQRFKIPRHPFTEFLDRETMKTPEPTTLAELTRQYNQAKGNK